LDSLRAQSEYTHMLRTHRREMPAVSSEDFGCIQSLRSRNDRGIDEPQVEIGVFREKYVGADHVIRLERLNGELTIAYCAHKRSLSLLRDSRMKQVADFR